ncbi:hypothetical protein T440DRAFT_457015 [Plenodomus tracheiphilus IPT5]|uniref:Zn(2)-C6 fungal-type domain-containing protein n=1 Tax=Plenodomus tracheiphilus IPT5 TaxID=1408161 RepID=A0A6A7AVV1_9PLEO|nr:hypothetical protein T440DRAFT_457015 [Plenodomus tracheiphilus IPT5]
MAQTTVSPLAEYDFDFNLPHGVDIDDYPIDSATHAVNSVAPHGDEDSHDADDNEPEQEEHDNLDNDDTLIGDGVQDMNYNSLPKGISDDEDAGPAFDRSYRPVLKTKRSPRRKHVDDLEIASPPLKKPYKSIFGDPTQEDALSPCEGSSMDMKDEIIPKTPGHGIGIRMSSLNIEQQDREHSPSDRPFNVGFDVLESETGDQSMRDSPALPDYNVVIPPDTQPAYQLRQNIERKKAFTYIDTDMSGNFDPSDEVKQRMSRLKKDKTVRLAQQKRKGKQSAPKEHTMKLIVRLRFAAFGNVRNYTNEEQNWPDNWSDIESECERERQEFREFFRPNTPGRSLQTPIEDPSGEADDLTGYPVARGCKCCRKNNHDCSMVEDGVYPCMQCANENDYCEPIVSTVKGRCKKCVEDGTDVCSFEDDPGQAVCDHCTEGEFVCEALPPDGYRASRININELVYGEDRPYTACTVCRQEKKRCSLKKKTDKPPCKYCKKNHIGCTFFDLPKQEPAKNTTGAAGGRRPYPTEGDAPEVARPSSSYFTAEDLADMEMADEETSSREATPEIEMEDNAGNKGLLTKIMTSFAHPIEFNVVAEETSDCNFCEMPIFGMVGHFEREVHVIRWDNGRGFTEIGGGYCEDKGPTRMCGTCTVSRLQIIVCDHENSDKHELRRIVDEGVVQDFDAVTDDLISAEPGSPEMQYQLTRWCSMCFSVAVFGCARIQLSLSGEEEEQVVGCGLRLCERCAIRLKDGFKSKLDTMACHMEVLPKVSIRDEGNDNLEGRARADVGFLRKDGLLMTDASAEA